MWFWRDNGTIDACANNITVILATLFPTKHYGNVACWMPLVSQQNLKDVRKLAFWETTLYTFLFFRVVCLLSIRGIKPLVPCVDGRSAPIAVQLISMRRLLRCSFDGVHFLSFRMCLQMYCYTVTTSERCLIGWCLCCQFRNTEGHDSRVLGR